MKNKQKMNKSKVIKIYLWLSGDIDILGVEIAYWALKIWTIPWFNESFQFTHRYVFFF